jgi:hypothetical protein
MVREGGAHGEREVTSGVAGWIMVGSGGEIEEEG